MLIPRSPLAIVDASLPAIVTLPLAAMPPVLFNKIRSRPDAVVDVDEPEILILPAFATKAAVPDVYKLYQFVPVLKA